MKVLLRLEDLSKRYGDHVLFDGAHASFFERQKIGVIGCNGAGKTTLLRILLGEEDADAGRIVRSPGVRLGHLEQRDAFEPGETVLAFLRRETGREPWACGKMAGRFGVGERLQSEAFESLPGGFRTRVKLAAMLLQEPDLLLLDEPTNYLDLRTLLRLERFLRDAPLAALVVSHDREFLKRTCTRTLAIEHGRIETFDGDVEDWLAHQEEHVEHARRTNRNVEARRRELQAFVDRFRAKNTKARQAQSKLKQIARLETIRIDHPASRVRIPMPPVAAKQGPALRCEELVVGYPGTTVARAPHLEFEQGSRVAVLGDNGEGKTTLLRTIAGTLSPLGGTMQWAHGLETAYFAQHVDQALHPEEEIHSHLQRVARTGATRQDVLDMAGAFLFRGDDVRKRIAVLSGGERARLCLAGVLLGARPVLLLDEPTNHLDFETVEALGDALRRFSGTIVFVSHDRTFVKLVATQVVEIRGGRIRHFPGSYEAYVHRLDRQLAGGGDGEPASGIAATSRAATSSAGRGGGREANEARIETEEHVVGTNTDRPGDGSVTPAGRAAYEARKQHHARVRKQESRLRELEGRVSALERERRELLAAFERDPTGDTKDRAVRLHEVSRRLEEEEARWFAVQEELEALRADEPS